MLELMKQNKVLIYFSLTLLLSWIFWVPFALFAPKGGSTNSPIFLLQLIGNFGPLFAAILTNKLTKESNKQFFKKVFYTSFDRKLLFLAPLIVLAISLPVIVGVSINQIISLLPLVLFFVIVSGFGEEPGWRGFAFNELENKYGLIKSALLIGVVWSVWHLPILIWTATALNTFILDFCIFIATITSLSIILSILTKRSNYNILPAILTHAFYTGINSSLLLLPNISLLQRMLIPVFTILLAIVMHESIGNELDSRNDKKV